MPPYWAGLNAKVPFNMTAQSFARAIASAGLGKLESKLFAYMQEQCWTSVTMRRRGDDGRYGSAASCEPNISDLARKFGVYQQSLQKAKTNLIRSRMLIEDDRDRNQLRINKNAHEWIIPSTGRPRLSGHDIAYCLEAQPKVQAELFTAGDGGPPHRQKAVGIAASCLQIPLPFDTPAPTAPGMYPLQPRECTPYSPGNVPPTAPGMYPPIEERARELDSPKNPKEGEESPPPPRPVEVQQAKAASFGPSEASKAVAGPGRDSAEATDLGRWAGQYGADLGELARQWCDDVPAAWIKVLFQRKVVGSTAVRSPLGWIQYLGKILGEWHEAGSCEYLKGSSPAQPLGTTAPEPPPAKWPGFIFHSEEELARRRKVVAGLGLDIVRNAEEVRLALAAL